MRVMKRAIDMTDDELAAIASGAHLKVEPVSRRFQWTTSSKRNKFIQRARHADVQSNSDRSRNG